MIIGVGIDIIDNRRIEKIITKFGRKFKSKCFTEIEIKKSENHIDSINFFSKRYAAKEAFSKALGTGFANGIYWKDIEIVNNDLGKPFIVLYNQTKLILSKITNNNYKIFLSMSDEKNYSIANVIIYKNEK